MQLFGSRNKSNELGQLADRDRRAAEAEASGLKCLKDGNLRSAEIEFRRCIELQPTSALGQGYLGLVLYRLGRLEEAELTLQASLRLSPLDEVLSRTHGMILEAMGKLDEAARAYEAAVRSNPNSARAHAALGSLALKEGNLEAAEASVMTALALDPKDPQALGEMADIRYRLGSRDDAIALLRQAMHYHPNSATFHLKLGMLLESENQIGAALLELQKAFDRKPHDLEVTFALGRAMIRAGAEGDVQTLYERAIRAVPENGPRYEADLYRLLAEFAAASGNTSTATPHSAAGETSTGTAQHAQSATNTTEDTLQRPTAISRIQTDIASQGNQTPIERIEAAVRAEPTNSKLYRDLSIEYMRVGRLTEAKEMARKAEDLRATALGRQSQSP